MLAFTYVSVVFVLVTQQISPILLAGLTAFLFFERHQRWFAMGASAVMFFVKPHLFYLFWIVFILWVWHNRKWSVILGTTLAGMGAALVPLLFDRQIYRQYFALYHIPEIPRPLDWLTPTPRSVIRVVLGPAHPWLQYLPSVVAIGWLFDYWQRHKHEWRWREQMPLVVLVSVTSSIFSWTYDQVVFLPAIIEAAIWIRRQAVPWHALWTTRVYVAINLCHILQRIFVADELWYFWLAPALLINYLIFRGEMNR